ncbi:MAG: hypothetical protein PVG06_13555 [Desulfobacterales bacterium]|jgi:hypothetical protein
MIGLKIKIGSLPGGIILFCMALSTLSGCAMSNYGKLESSPDITRAFETYQIMPDHTYYYRGTFSNPFVIAGVNKIFRLNSKLWVEIDTQSQDFRTLIDRVSLQGSGRNITPSGFTILDHSGRNVGVWYSAISAATIEVNENGQIVNLAPLRIAKSGKR